MVSSKGLITAAFALFASAASAVSPSKVGGPVVFGKGGTYPRATKLADGSLV